MMMLSLVMIMMIMVILEKEVKKVGCAELTIFPTSFADSPSGKVTKELIMIMMELIVMMMKMMVMML